MRVDVHKKVFFQAAQADSDLLNRAMMGAGVADIYCLENLKISGREPKVSYRGFVQKDSLGNVIEAISHDVPGVEFFIR